ncbi:MAG: hypothetical protein FLDDKLPJ_01709 [Phycisphaerae bacterium]|nr:hypothetical protein [Phycisphaerae bacterium]
MFSGIVECKGCVTGLRTGGGGGVRLRVQAARAASGTEPGASLAVSGVCLTVAGIDGEHIEFDVVPETLRRTTLGDLRVGAWVNLERSLRVGDRLDGHFVQGHVDGTATVAEVIRRTDEHVLRFTPERGLMAYMIPKGSVAVDGVSLTIAEAAGDTFTVALIPTTLQVTTLGDRRVGDRVNVESDILIRALFHRLSGGGAPSGATGLGEGAPAANRGAGSNVTQELLERAGFVQ